MTWGALEPEGRLGEALRLGFYTGARVSEILGLPWAEIDIPARLWTIAPERSKNGEAHPIPLSSGALTVLNLVKTTAGAGPFVFASPRLPAGAVRSVQHCMARVTSRSSVDFRFHDIRRTVATGLASLGSPDHVVEAVLGHSPARLKRTYNRYQPIREMQAALESWAAHLHRLVSGEQTRTADVLPLARR